MLTVTRYYKAIAALLGPAVAALVVAWFVATPHVITDAEWQLIIGAVVGGGGLTAVAPKNRTRAEVHAARTARIDAKH